jgi:hypothetical protein
MQPTDVLLATAPMAEWNAAQLVLWATLLSLPELPLLQSIFLEDDVDGEEFVDMKPKMLQRMLKKAGAADPEGATQTILAQRVDALARQRQGIPSPSKKKPMAMAAAGAGQQPQAGGKAPAEAGGTTKKKAQAARAQVGSECPICFEEYADDAQGLRVPRIITKCGHTACHGCIANMLTRVLANGNSKPFPCPTCSVVTNVSRGRAANLARNFTLLAALGQ